MFQNLLDPSAWFTLSPAQVGEISGNIVFLVFVLLFVCGIVARIVASHKIDDRHMRELGKRIGSFLVTMGILGAMLYFFSYERIRLFGARFWYVLWLVGFLVWVVYIARYARKTVPKMKEQAIALAQKRRYFPGRKH